MSEGKSAAERLRAFTDPVRYGEYADLSLVVLDAIAAAERCESLEAENSRLERSLKAAIETAYKVGCQAVIDAATKAGSNLN